MFTLTLFTGPAGCSKTTLTELIRDYLADDPTKVLAIDTSDCLEMSRKQGTNAGKLLDSMIEAQRNGIILPGDPVMDSILENLDWYEQRFHPYHFGLAGSPRSPEEVGRWLKARKQTLLSFRVVLIGCNYEQVKQGVHNRVLKGSIRADAGPAEVANRWKEYNEKTVPAIDLLPSELVVRTSRSKKLLARLFDAVNHMEIPGNVRKRWLRKLSERSHPIHEAIRGIENAKDIQAKQSVAVQRREFSPAPAPHGGLSPAYA